MAKKTPTSDENFNEVIIDAATIQLASFNAGIEFWSRWLEEATELSDTWRKGLQDFIKDPENNSATILKMTEASQKNLRNIKSLPRQMTDRFVKEYSQLQSLKKKGTKKSPRNFNPKRAARVKR